MPSIANSNLELFTLAWLDNMVDATQENREIQTKLRSVINSLRTFHTCHECEHYLRDTNENIILIVSGRLGQEIIELIHDFKQITSIFVFCFDKERNERWAKNYKKIRHVIIHLNDLLHELNLDQQSDEQKFHQSINFSTDGDDDRLFPFLLQIKSTCLDRKSFLHRCSQIYKENLSALEHVHDFEHLYVSSKALDYFFRQTFLYRLLIRSFQTSNIELLYLLRFFLQDIHQQMQTCSISSTKVYRGQLMTTNQLDLFNGAMEKDKIRFHTFIIANPNRDDVLKSLQNASNANNLQRVLFEIDQNQLGREYQHYVLFPIITYFRIVSIRLEHRIWIIQMIVDNQSFVQQDSNPFDLPQYLREIGQLDQAEKLYELLLTQYPTSNARCYDGLGRIAQDRSFYELSLNFYFKSLQTIPLKYYAYCLNNIGCAYDYLEQYEEALQFYSEALSLMKSEIDQSMCLNNMGITYAKTNQYDQALPCLQRSLAIRKNSFSNDHPEMGISYTNLAVLWSSLGQSDDALECYQLALKIFSLNHHSLDLFRGIVYQNLADLFQQKNQSDRALKLYKDARKILRHIRSNDHPNLQYIQQQIDQQHK